MKTPKTRKVQTSKTNYMSDEAFADLKKGMEDAVAFERGKRRNLKVTKFKLPEDERQCQPEILLASDNASTAPKRSSR